MSFAVQPISCSFGVIQASKNDSVIKKAAYNCREKIYSDKLGELINYSFRQDLLADNILAPDGAESWVFNRQEHYNKVEKQDNRINSQLGRTIRIGLPHELSLEENKALLEDYLKTYFVKLGMVADYAIHAPEPDGDERNIHTHVILSMRRLDGDKFSKKKARDWNSIDVETWREAWANEVNRLYEAKGIDKRVTHLSLERQGSNKLPQRHLGKKSTNLRRHKGIETSRAEYNNLIKEYNQLIDEIASVQESEEDNETDNLDSLDSVAGRTSLLLENISRVKEEEFNYWIEIQELEGVEAEAEKDKIEVFYQTLELRAVELSEQIIEIDRRRQRKPDRKRDTAEQDVSSESLKRSSTPTTSESEADAVQKTVTLEGSTSAPAKVDGNPTFAGVELESNNNHQQGRSRGNRSENRAKLIPKNEDYSKELEALKIAQRLKSHMGNKDSKISAVNAYRLALAEAVKNYSINDAAYHYYKQSNTALECDRIIRNYLRTRGYSKPDIDRAMRRASPAMYRKSETEARRYAKRFKDYVQNWRRKQKSKQEDREQKLRDRKREQRQNKTRRR